MTYEDGTMLEQHRYRVYGEHEVLNSCYGKGKIRVIVRNPYYRNIDPMKRIMKGSDPNSRTLIFNPFSPLNSIEYKNTYDKITKGRRLVMPEVDPYFW